MAKAKRQYICQNCGSATYRCQGQCADCGEWNTLVEEAGETVFSAKHDLSRGGPTLALDTLDPHSKLPLRILFPFAHFLLSLSLCFLPVSASLLVLLPFFSLSSFFFLPFFFFFF